MMQSIEFGDKSTTCCGHLIFWSDAFLKCFSRQRENSIWLFVVRICPPNGLSTSEEHTFCLAFGSSKLNHDKLIEYYLKEVRDILMKGQTRYYGKPGVRRKVNTCFGLALYAADTPEQNKIIHRLRLGLFCKRSLHATKIDPRKLPSCDRCFWRMFQQTFTFDEFHNQNAHRTCNRCCNWDQFSQSTANRFDTTANTSYPSTSSTPNPHAFPEGQTPNKTYIQCVRQTSPQLVQGARVAFFEHSQGVWPTKTVTKAFLHSFAIDHKITNRILSAADSVKKGNIVHENEYIPRIWQLGFSIDLFLEMAMHLLGHGIIPSVLELTEAVLSENRIWTAFKEYANPLLSDIASFRLD